MNEALLAEMERRLNEGQAFCWLPCGGEKYLMPVHLQNNIRLQDLQGIERQKQAVVDNVQRFLAQQSFHHMLLWGARGSGKSSLIRATAAAFADRGLAIVQIGCADLADLPFLLLVLARVPKCFLLYIDDLSFMPDDASYRALKAVLDGSIAGISANIMICVTSNRRHLLSEYHSADAVHPNEEIEEQISLSERFGLWLSFYPASQDEYLNILRYWAEVLHIPLNDEDERQALQYALRRGARNGRIARQFLHNRIPSCS